MSKATDALSRVIEEQVDNPCDVSQVVQFLLEEGAVSHAAAQAVAVKYEFLRRYGNSNESATSIMLDMSVELGPDRRTILRWVTGQ